MVFEERARTRTAPKQPGEDEFAFYDAAAGAPYGAYRALLNGWMEDYPEAERKEAIARFRKGGTLVYQAALAELLVHATLRTQGYIVEIHPPCGHKSRRPDFLTRDAGGGAAVAFVEVTTFGPAINLVGRSKRGAAVYNGIDSARLPAGCRLGIEILKHGANTPSLKKLRASIEKWASRQGEIEAGTTRTQVFTIDDWEIEIVSFGEFSKDVIPDRAIATAMGELRKVRAAAVIREALSTKGSAYDPLDAPYLVVVADCKDELVGGRHNGEALLEAVLGTIYTEVRTTETGEQVIVDRRWSDGYWGTAEAPAHGQVGGVLLLPKPHLWDLREERWQPSIVRNGRAERPLPAKLMPVPGFSIGSDGQVNEAAGTPLADIVGLPDVWPPESYPSAETDGQRSW
jgi:hypothetical protein